MTELKRDLTKYTRDFIKKDYKQRDKCYICNSTKQLELHHLYSIAELLGSWLKKNNYSIETAELIMELRVIFYKEHKDELNNDNLYTLCKPHHERLHHIYSQRYPNVMVPKIRNWLEIQKRKGETK